MSDPAGPAPVAVLTLGPLTKYSQAELYEACQVYKLLARGRLILAPKRGSE